ncbi:MAG: DNA polymerase III subunit gamma/tau [Bacteroidaceae bacterium]|nr:DNA polymerase III subunit gamma/tau [Bacteroidaceae bacterium]
MENYIVSARKYRPDTFDTVVAQKSLTTTLKNAIQSGKLAHAYLFCGPRGVGKTTCARIFAKTINCEHLTPDGEPCNECESCISFNQQRSFSIYELDAASNNSVDDIRSLNEQVRIPPPHGRYKVYIIDEVHMLTTQAFNAFLKTLEEPPAHAIFILATTEKHKIIPTILSRCQIYDFSRIESADIIAHLQQIAAKEGLNAEYEALRIVAQKSDGCMRDALSLFDQMVSFTQGDLTYSKVIESLNVLDYNYYFRFTDYILEGNISQALLLFNEVLVKGFEGSIFVEGAASHFRDLLVASDPATVPLFEGSAELCARYTAQAAKCAPKLLFRAIKLCSDCSAGYRASRNKRLLVELTIIQLSQLASDDAEEAGGRRPKQLKPIFSNPAAMQAQATVQQSAAPAAAVQASSAPATQRAAVQQAPMQQTVQQRPAEPEQRNIPVNANVARPVPQGRPEALRPRPAQAGGPTLGGMFRSTMGAMQQPQQKQAADTAAVSHTQQPQVVKRVTSEELVQAWVSFAMTLPDNERALADRMRIILPTLQDNDTFSIVVDNQHVAAMFEGESKRILGALEGLLGGARMRMRVDVNQVVVQRHVYDRTKQYEILKEKNGLVGKLRDAFGLELS